MLTGTCKTINDSMFSLVSNLMIPLELFCPVILSVVSRNWYFLFLIITPYLSAYAVTFIAALSGVGEKEMDGRIQNMCLLSDVTHVLVESLMIVVISGVKVVA